MEDLKNVAEETTMEETNVIDLYPAEDECETESHGFGKLMIGLGLAATAAVVAVAVKNKDKIKQKKTEKMIKKLEEQGYLVAEEYADIDEDFCEEEESEVEDTEESEE